LYCNELREVRRRTDCLSRRVGRRRTGKGKDREGSIEAEGGERCEMRARENWEGGLGGGKRRVRMRETKSVEHRLDDGDERAATEGAEAGADGGGEGGLDGGLGGGVTDEVKESVDANDEPGVEKR
jgi:hypothetical protein